jgi:hypothetical protein
LFETIIAVLKYFLAKRIYSGYARVSHSGTGKIPVQAKAGSSDVYLLF